MLNSVVQNKLTKIDLKLFNFILRIQQINVHIYVVNKNPLQLYYNSINWYT